MSITLIPLIMAMAIIIFLGCTFINFLKFLLVNGYHRIFWLIYATIITIPILLAI